MNQIISDFLQLGPLRLISRILTGLRGLVIIMTLIPSDLGQYTIWLLFIFYAAMFDFAIATVLERDIPHHKGRGDTTAVRNISDIGWSLYFLLSTVVFLILAVIVYAVYKDLVLALYLGTYFISDKIFRAYEMNSRIEYLYKENGIASLFVAGSSLVLVWLLLPKYGPYIIFPIFTFSGIAGCIYLHAKCPLNFNWYVNIKDYIYFIRGGFLLWILVYSIEFFHAVSLTVLALKWSKETLGYFAFAFRIFQIAWTIFPSLIGEVVRTRMYYQVSQIKKGEDPFANLLAPMMAYSMIAAIFYLLFYWWADLVVNSFMPTYLESVDTTKILMIALVPLGVMKICSDYLYGNMQKKTFFVICAWTCGSVIQASLLFFLNLTKNQILFAAPIAYLSTTFLVYCLIAGEAFEIRRNFKKALKRMSQLIFPVISATIIVLFIKRYFHISPGQDIKTNLIFFLLSAMILCFSVLLFISDRRRLELKI